MPKGRDGWRHADVPNWLEPHIGSADPFLISAIAAKWADHCEAGPSADALFSVIVAWPASNPQARKAFRRILAKEKRNRLCNAHLKARMSFTTAEVDLTTIRRLLSSTAPVFQIALVQPLRADRPLPSRVVRLPSHAKAPQPPERTVLLGVIDHGCPFAHTSLRDKDGASRVVALWDQDAQPASLGRGSLPSGFDYGAELDGCLLKSCMDRAKGIDGVVDEALCYRLADYSPMRFKASHGAQVLGLIAGTRPSRSLGSAPNPMDDVAASAPIVFVQLPRQIVQAPSGPAVERAVLDGVQYILGHAKPQMRVVITVDYGSYLGPHDGNSIFEKALDELIHAARVRGVTVHIVFPAGNAREESTHAALQPLALGQTAKLAWWVPLGNGVPTHAELWLGAALHDLEITVTPPGRPSQVLTVTGPRAAVWPSRDRPTCTVVAQDVGSASTPGCRVFIRLAATGQDDAGHAGAPAGRWIVSLKASSVPVARGDAYVAFGHANMGVPKRSFQSQLIPLKAFVLDGNASLNGSACGEKVWVVGGYVKSTGREASYSAVGPARGGLRKRFNVDAYAVSEEGTALKGVAGIGNVTGTVARLRGTSVAAPQAARELAEFNNLAPRSSSNGQWPPRDRCRPGPVWGEPADVSRFLDYYNRKW